MATSAPCVPSGALARIALSAATCMPGSSVVQTSIGSLVWSIKVSSCGSAQSVK